MKITRSGPMRGEIKVPGDKSISHRAVMLGSISEGVTRINGFLAGADCLSTIGCFRKMGIEIEQDGDQVTIHGRGLRGLASPALPLDCGNSGTTTRLISGILAGQSFDSVLTGDSSIQKRPMKRIIEPLRLMGADISGCDRDDKSFTGDYAPLRIRPSELSGIDYTLPVSSAQVKSAILLAGLYAKGPTTVREAVLSRNHTELMLESFGADLRREKDDEGRFVSTLTPGALLTGTDVTVPGDISSAAYAMVAALLIPGSEVLIKNVGINDTRAGILSVLKDMGADIMLINRSKRGEPYADILVRSSHLSGTVIGGDIIPSLIDELPVLAVAAACADGRTVIKDAAELKVKESDRIETVSDNLRAMGADVTPTDDGMIIEGGKPLKGAGIYTCSDHRIAMSFTVAGLVAEGETQIDDSECAVISYPGFYDDLFSLRVTIHS